MRLRRAAVAAGLIAALALSITASGVAQTARAPSRPPLLTFSSGVVVPHGDYRLALRLDGTGTLTLGTGTQDPVTLSLAMLDRLQAQLDAAHFPALARRYIDVATPLTGVDPAVITYEGQTVTVRPGAVAPKPLDALVDTLRALVQRFEVTPPAAHASPTLVTFVGGFEIADDNYRLTVRADGRGTLVDAGRHYTVTLSATRLRQLRRRLTAADFPALRHDYDHVTIPIRGPAPIGVSYHGTTVIVQPGARTPAALGRVIETLRAIVGEFG